MEESKIRDRKALERLYLVVALALLFATCSWYGSSTSWAETKSSSSSSGAV